MNKGIKILFSINRICFAYNNGITATATHVETENGYITKIVDFQIVNGGQTTSAIYALKEFEIRYFENICANEIICCKER